jgi:protein phosphatase
MKAVVKRIKVSKGKRIIAISDIHGNLEAFKKLLDKICFTGNDILILLGDLIEKGDMSLKTLRYVINMSKCGNVYAISGNCDTLWEDIKGEVDDANLLRYMIVREKSILNEMCQELSIEVNEQSDIKYIKGQIRKNFSNELDWLEQLPHIIETENYIFVHAGITSENLEEQNAYEVMKNNAFMEMGLAFSKYVVVGHWPTANYGKEKRYCNPIINEKQKIISIDGGNMIKSEGQLNALIIDADGNITFDSVDDLPKGWIIEDQESNTNTIQITWVDNLIEVIKADVEFSLCRHVSSNHELWIRNDKIFKTKDGMRCYDCTDYFLLLKKGDIVSIIEKANNQTLAKKDGTIGWVLNEKLREEKIF